MAFASPSELPTHFHLTTKKTHHHHHLLPSQAFLKINGDPQLHPNINLAVAYQGAPGAYSEFAAKTACPNSKTIPYRSLIDAILAVESGHVDRAILPVESTMEGSSLRNYNLLLQHDLHIVQEISLFVHYCLLAMPGVRKTELKRVMSHPLALAHCVRNLAQLGLEREPVEDTAGAVELLRARRLFDTGAIASSRAALLYGLDVVAHGLQDESWNVTRFLVLSKDSDLTQKGRVGLKTSLVVGHHGSGGMEVVLGVLSALSSRGINLTKLEVGSNRKEDGVVRILDVHGRRGIQEFPHVLYIDFEGTMEDEKVKEAIDEVSNLSVFVRVLGCYMADPNVYDLF